MSCLPITRSESKKTGNKYYITGKPCVHGHFSRRLTSTGQCVECLHIRNKSDWADPQKRQKKIAQLSAYLEKVKDPEYQKQYRSRENVKAMRAIYNKRAHEILSKSKDFRKKKAMITREWVKNNRDRHRANANARRHRVRAAGKFSAKEVLMIFDLQGGRCANPSCNKKIDNKAKNSFHIDHIVPVSKGGKNEIGNIQCLCPVCNLKKSNKMPDVWAKEHGRLF